MDLSALGTARFDLAFLSGLLSITVIDLILAGDNAVVIAMAVRSLPKDKRRKGILFGSGAAVLLRVAITFFVSRILTMSYVKLVGGLVIIWIAVKLFVEDEEAQKIHKEGTTLWHAIRLIVIADITMALDNMLAVGAASHGNLFLLLFGLGLSIPFVILTSSLLSALMDKFPVILYIGAALLGKIGGEMIITDPMVGRLLTPTKPIIYSCEILFAAGVIIAGRFWLRRGLAKQETETE